MFGLLFVVGFLLGGLAHLLNFAISFVVDVVYYLCTLWVCIYAVVWTFVVVGALWWFGCFIVILLRWIRGL